MRSQFNSIPCGPDRRAQRAFVLQVLSDDHRERWSGADLEGELSDIERDVPDVALAGLTAAGVVLTENGVVWAS